MKELFLYYCGVQDVQQTAAVNAFTYQPVVKITPQLQPKSTKRLKLEFETLEDLRKALQEKLRDKLVFSAGDEKSRVMIIGDAPQQNTHTPFSDESLSLLQKMFNAIELPLDQTYQTTLCCAPQQILSDIIIAEMLPYLEQHIKLIAPKILVLMGNKVTRTLLRQEKGILSLRGQFHDYKAIKALPIFHPQFLLQQPQQKRKAWEDLQKLQEWLKEHA